MLKMVSALFKNYAGTFHYNVLKTSLCTKSNQDVHTFSQQSKLTEKNHPLLLFQNITLSLQSMKLQQRNFALKADNFTLRFEPFSFE